MKITTILPVSRIKYLDRVLGSLDAQTHAPDNLLVVFDGHDDDYPLVCEKVNRLKIPSECIRSFNSSVTITIPERRMNITNIHNQLRTLVDADWIFSIEDDGVLADNALEQLVKTAQTFSNPGFVTGVELGRWGTPYVGAWRVNDINTPTQIESLEVLGSGVEKIDAAGLYCALIKGDLYRQHEFFCHNGLGPDVNLGLFIRQHGYNNYINWDVSVIHLTNFWGEEKEIHPTDPSVRVRLELLYGSTWQLLS